MLCLLHEELYLPVILLEGITKHLAKKIYRLCDSGSRNIGAVSNYRSNKRAKKKKRKENGIKQSEM